MADPAGRANGARSRDPATTPRRSAALALAAAAAAVVVAGCGGSKSPAVAHVATTASSGAAGKTSTTGGAGGSGSPPSPTGLQQDALKYARCMRAGGVPDFPDPMPGGGFEFHPGAGIDRSSPAFRAAQEKCAKFMAGGLGHTPGSTTHPSAQWLATMVKAAQCMRRRGIAAFPDPTTTVPSLSGFVGVISDIEGAIFVLPASLDTQSPLFTRAARTCGFPLHNH
jgi:hypothetical protein